MIRWFPPADQLYAVRNPIPVGRPAFQGDVYDGLACYRYPARPEPEVTPKSRTGLAMLLGHPCELSEGEKGGDRLWRLVCPVVHDRDRRLLASGDGDYYAFPLPNLLGDDELWYADFRFLSTCHRDYVVPASRVAALSRDGWYALQRRLAHYFCRVVVHENDLVAAGAGLFFDEQP